MVQKTVFAHLWLWHTLVYSGILWYTLAYSGIINASLITADGACHCPLGSIWPFLSNSHRSRLELKDARKAFGKCFSLKALHRTSKILLIRTLLQRDWCNDKMMELNLLSAINFKWVSWAQVCCSYSSNHKAFNAVLWFGESFISLENLLSVGRILPQCVFATWYRESVISPEFVINFYIVIDIGGSFIKS